MTKKLESVEVCKKEIDESLEALIWLVDKVEAKELKFRIINNVEIIRIFTEVLIKHIKKR